MSGRLPVAGGHSGPAGREVATGANPFLPAPASIVRVTELLPDVRLFELRLVDPSLADEFSYRPGQFVELSVLGVGEAPFSLPSWPARRGRFELGIRRAGVLTGYLFDHIAAGDVVGVRGPLGNGFPVDRFEGHDLLVVAGGLGIVPLRGLLQYLVDARERFGRVIVLYGCRNPGQVLFKEELELLQHRGDAEVVLTVDDPAGLEWTGRSGYVTDLVAEIEIDPGSTFAVACGPPLFYKFLLDKLVATGLAKDHIFLSLERRMECGVGKCGHCAVGYTFTCLHGPVFSYWDAINLPELIYE